MILLSCVNCCHNPLQSDCIGAQHGYCTQHRKLLLAPEQLTCGRHLRKDLPLASAYRERGLHEQRFTPSAIVRLSSRKQAPVNGGYTSTSAADLDALSDDRVSDAVFEYGKLDSKIASLAQLKAIDTARAELAMLSLARAYVGHCVARGGNWTSGLHLAWWTRRRLGTVPEVHARDLRTSAPLAITRQIELAQWSLVMTRLLFLSDLGVHAEGIDEISALASLADQAAVATREINLRRLLGWIGKTARPALDRVLPVARYEQLAARLHVDGDER